MTTIDTHSDTTDVAGGTLDTASAAAEGVYEWLTSTDHKRIGRLFVGTSFLALAGVAVLGLLFGIERADDSVVNFDSDALLQLVQGYRAGLLFAVAAPLAIGLTLAVTPLQVGARTAAFPRVALAGFYAWLGGLVLTYGALAANGGIGGGDSDMIDLFLAGHGLMILGLLAAAGSVATTILTARAPGMTMRRLPLFAWSALVTAIGALLVLPVAFGTIVYVFVDHRIGEQLNFGGPEGIGDWLAWLWSTPTVLVFAIPALGLFAELVPVTFSGRQAMRGVAFAGLALVGVVALSGLTQQLALEVSLDPDQAFADFLGDLLPYLLLNGLPLLGLAVAGGAAALTIKQALADRRPSPRAPFVFGLFGLLAVEAAVIGNALLSITDLELIATTFEEGVVVLAVYGAVTALMGGAIYWAPKLSGRIIADAKALPIAALAIGGAVLAGGSMLVAGALGQPGMMPNSDAAVASSLDLSASAPIWNIIALIGHGAMVLAVLMLAGLLLTTTVDEGPVEENPYGGHTLEWTTLSPAPTHNYERLATVSSAEPAFESAPGEATEGDAS